MCSSFTWGIVSVHYLLGLPLAYALHSATPNGLMLLVKLTYSPVMLRPIESFYLPRCSILSPSSVVHCVLFSPLPHDTMSCSIFGLLCALLPSVPDSCPSLGRPLRLALIASACSMATAHTCPANIFRMYCRTSSLGECLPGARPARYLSIN